MVDATLAVDAVPTGEQRPVRGAVTFIDNAVDVTTGTIRLKATFGNQERRLWPGQFANVALTLAVQPDALVDPLSGLADGPAGGVRVRGEARRHGGDTAGVAARTQGNEAVIGSGLEAASRS